MELFFGMVGTTFDFFVDIGNRVNFLGLNLFEISFIFFMFMCLFRWLFPVIFAGEGAVPTGSASAFIGAGADLVKASNEKRMRDERKEFYKNERNRRNQG